MKNFKNGGGGVNIFNFLYAMHTRLDSPIILQTNNGFEYYKNKKTSNDILFSKSLIIKPEFNKFINEHNEFNQLNKFILKELNCDFLKKAEYKYF